MRKIIFFLWLLFGVSYGLFSQTNTLQLWEYWFDNDLDNTVTESLAGSQSIISKKVATDALPQGIHRLNYRAQDSRGKWSAVSTHYFVKVTEAASTPNELSTFEYWWNNDYNGRKSESVDKGVLTYSLDASSLKPGIQRLNYRLKDSRGEWSQTATHYFANIGVNALEGDNRIMGYKYWFNGDNSFVTDVAIEPTNPFAGQFEIDVDKLTMQQTPNSYRLKPSPSDGNHQVIFGNQQVLNMQFEDELGNWSATQVDTFAHDYTVPIVPILLHSQEEVSATIPVADSLRYYSFAALAGDSIVLTLDKYATIEVFDPYGRNVKSFTTSEGLSTFGLRTTLDGEHYAIVHTFANGQGSNYKLNYTHIAKYAVLGYNVKRVGNKGFTSITFEGNGFDNNTKLILTKDKITIYPDTLIIKGLGELTANINFTGVELGSYDIKFLFADESINIKDGLQVEAPTETKLTTTIIGSKAVRAGIPTVYTIVIENSGNTTCYFPPVDISISYQDENSIKDVTWHTPFAPSELYETFKDLIDEEDAEHLKELDADKDGLNKFIDNGKMLNSQFLIPEIPANSKKEISFTVQTDGDIDIRVNTPITWDIQENGETDINNLINQIDCFLNTINCVLSILPTPELDPDCLRKTLMDFMKPNDYESKASTMLTVLSAIKESKENNSSPLATLGNISNNYLLDLSRDLLLTQVTCMARDGKMSKQFSKFLKKSIPVLKIAYAIYDCTPIVEAVLNGECFGKTSESSLNATVIRSYDPNDKLGYRSPSGSTYFNDSKTNFSYIINFENDAEKATAAAQEVFITDTLDLSKFDIESFRAGMIKIGDRVVQAPYDVQEHTWQVDMRPEMELRTEVALTLDKDKGIAHWVFRSIDPMTGELTTDPWAGFLPINDEHGSGQGLVSFSIDLKEGIKEEEAVVNSAEIIFDNNEPLITDPWSNVKDLTPPISRMNMPQVQDATKALLTWNGEDNLSGVYQYDLWTNIDGGAFYEVANGLSEDSYLFDYYPDFKYQFYVIAIDSAMNREVKNRGEVELQVISVKNIAVTPTEAEMVVGEEMQITLSITPENATNPNVAWNSTDSEVADVSLSGLVTAIAEGEAIVTATSEEGGKEASSKIKVVTEATGWDATRIVANVYVQNNHLIIEAETGLPCRIITSTGMEVSQFITSETKHQVALRIGVYIVIIGNKTYKVSIL